MLRPNREIQITGWNCLWFLLLGPLVFLVAVVLAVVQLLFRALKLL